MAEVAGPVGEPGQLGGALQLGRGVGRAQPVPQARLQGGGEQGVVPQGAGQGHRPASQLRGLLRGAGERQRAAEAGHRTHVEGVGRVVRHPAQRLGEQLDGAVPGQPRPPRGRLEADGRLQPVPRRTGAGDLGEQCPGPGEVAAEQVCAGRLQQ
jgi:hypothetical protein